jgi:hypothetical protein
MTVVLSEQFTFNKNSVIWTFSLGGALDLSGIGTAKISKNAIAYNIPFTITSGGSTVAGKANGTIKLAKNNHLAVSETLSTSTDALPVLYTLGGKKPQK